MLLSFLRVVVENLLRSLRSEFGGEPGGLLATELPVVIAAHFVAPPVAVRDRESDAVLCEYLLESVPADGTGVGESCEHLVAENLLEPARFECLPAQLPVRLRLLRIREDLQSLVPHELVVKLAQAVLPRRIALKARASQVVVVGDEDVCMPVFARRVGVDDDHVVSGVHPLSEFHGDVSDAVEVLLLGHVELVRAEREDVALKLVLAAVRTCEGFGAFDERQRRGRVVAGDTDSERCRSSGGCTCKQLHAALVPVAVQHVGGRAHDIPRRTNIDGAHDAV